MIRHETRLVFRRDPTPQQMPRVGGYGVHPSSLAVEGQRIVAALGHPEIPVEACSQIRRLLAQIFGKLFVTPNGFGKFRGSQERVIYVTLYFAEGDPPFRQGSVTEEHGVRGVLPALILEAPGRAFLVGDV